MVSAYDISKCMIRQLKIINFADSNILSQIRRLTFSYANLTEALSASRVDTLRDPQMFSHQELEEIGMPNATIKKRLSAKSRLTFSC